MLPAGCRQRLSAIVAGVRHTLRNCIWARPAAAHITGMGTDLLRSRAQLLVENALLRHQVVILRRSVKRPAATAADRALLVLLASRVRAWRHALLIVRPETLLGWHRAGFRAVWRWKSRPGPGLYWPLAPSSGLNDAIHTSGPVSSGGWSKRPAQEVARAVGARDGSAVSQWESGVNVPDGMLRERLADLLDGRRWPELRAAALAIESDGLPDRWGRAVRWYQRASRERRPRETVGAAVSAVLVELRDVASTAALRADYRGRDGDWAPAIVAQRGLGDEQPIDPRRAEDAAYGLRWLELAHGRRFGLDRSLVPQLPLALLK